MRPGRLVVAPALVAILAAMAARATPPSDAAPVASPPFPPAIVEFRAERSPASLGKSRSVTPLVKATLNGVPVELGVDTGAGLTVISESLAARAAARLLVSGGPEVKDTTGKKLAARYAEVELEVAGARFTGLPVIVLPDERLQAGFLGLRFFVFDGLLGWHALAATRATLDLKSRTLSLDPPARDCGPRVLRSEDLRPHVMARVQGREVTAFLDTGARDSWAIAGRPAWEGVLETSPSAAVVAGAGGLSFQSTQDAADVRVQVGDVELVLGKLRLRPGREGGAHDVTIGMDFFEGSVLRVDAGCGAFSLAR